MNNGSTLARFPAAGAIAVILVAGWTASVSQAQFLENNVRLLQTFTVDGSAEQTVDLLAQEGVELAHRRPSPRAMMPRSTSRVPPRRLNDGAAWVT